MLFSNLNKKFSELKNGDIGMVTKVQRQDLTMHAHSSKTEQPLK